MERRLLPFRGFRGEEADIVDIWSLPLATGHPDFFRVWTASMPGGLPPEPKTQSGISAENLKKLTDLMNDPSIGRVVTETYT